MHFGWSCSLGSAMDEKGLYILGPPRETAGRTLDRLRTLISARATPAGGLPAQQTRGGEPGSAGPSHSPSGPVLASSSISGSLALVRRFAPCMAGLPPLC
jgi:hypothetical protein